MNLRAVDLNLLVSLDTLLEQRNVTRAAEMLHLSQPALSAQLGRLRSLFGDPLLVPAESGRGMVATERALDLQAPLRALLDELGVLLEARAPFDPRTTQRVFQIASSDNATVVVGLAAIERLRREAGPGIRVAFRSADARTVAEQMERGQVDFLVGSERMVPESMKAVRLLDEDFVMAQRKGHPRGTAPVDLGTYCNDLEHVLVSTTGGAFEGFIDEQLERLQPGAPWRRNVVLSVQHFMLAVAILEHTDYVCALPRRLVARYPDTLDACELPFDAAGFSLFLAWHPRHQDSAPHRWMRDLIARAARAPTDSRPPASPAPA